MNKKQKSLTNKGFSLVELIIVIAIMAVLVGVLAPQFLKYVERSRKSTDFQNVASIVTALQTYAADQMCIRDRADRDVAIARAQAQKDANDAQVIAETEIAQKQTELAIKKAELKKESDIKKAEADAAYKIQEEEQRKTVEITTANANLARQEKELELKEREVSIKEKALEAEVKKTAEANKYAAQQKADAEPVSYTHLDVYKRQKYTSVLFCGSGTINIDACISSLLPEGGKVLVVDNGCLLYTSPSN